MNPKYQRNPTDAATTDAATPGDFRISGSLTNVAALIVIVASLFETSAIIGVLPSADFTAGACSTTFAVQAGEHSGLAQCQK
jgi:hypothetical protein